MIEVNDYVRVKKAKNPYDWVGEMNDYNNSVGKVKKRTKLRDGRIGHKILFHNKEEIFWCWFYNDSLIKLTEQDYFLEII
jgi:hypothetical protein